MLRPYSSPVVMAEQMPLFILPRAIFSIKRSRDRLIDVKGCGNVRGRNFALFHTESVIISIGGDTPIPVVCGTDWSISSVCGSMAWRACSFLSHSFSLPLSRAMHYLSSAGSENPVFW